MLTLFISAFLLGLIFNAAPGAIFAETVRRGLRGGFWPAFHVQFGSLVGDALWALLGLAGVGLLLQLDFLRLPIGIAGIVYLLWLAWDSWQEANALVTLEEGEGAAAKKSALRSGVLLSITNPQNIAYWAALGSAMASLGIQNPGFSHYAVFFLGFMLCSILWTFFCAAVVARVFRGTKASWAKLTYRLCALAFLTLALASLRSLLTEVSASDEGPRPVSTRAY